MDNKDLSNRFQYHAPSTEKVVVHTRVRTSINGLAEEFNLYIPEGREKSLALTKLEEAMFWANAAIARDI